jgi:predicted Fe-Mo cluster-binding NifX family protein
VTVAIPIWQERISPVLDAAARLLVVRQRRGAAVERREVTLGVLTPQTLARSVAELGVEALLCGAVSEGLRRALESEGIRVVSDLCGEVETVLRAFARGRLHREDFAMPGCWRRYGQPEVSSRCRTARRPPKRRPAKAR